MDVINLFLGLKVSGLGMRRMFGQRFQEDTKVGKSLGEVI